MFIGVDPDLHYTAFALWDGKQVIALWLAEATGRTERAACMAMSQAIVDAQPDLQGLNDCPVFAYAVEGQELYRGKGKTRNPRDIMFLATVAGAALSYCHDYFAGQDCVSFYPAPAEWKGQVPKDIHQSRTYANVGWESEKRKGYAVPVDAPFEFTATRWKHLGDAIGLAQWAGRQWATQAARSA